MLLDSFGKDHFLTYLLFVVVIFFFIKAIYCLRLCLIFQLDGLDLVLTAFTTSLTQIAHRPFCKTYFKKHGLPIQLELIGGNIAIKVTIGLRDLKLYKVGSEISNHSIVCQVMLPLTQCLLFTRCSNYQCQKFLSFLSKSHFKISLVRTDFS